MRLNSEALHLSRDTFVILRDLIHERTGIFFDDAKIDLVAEKLSPLVMQLGFTSFLDYYYYLKYEVKARTEWRRVMDAISVQETYFWREVDQVRVLVDVLVPRFFSGQNRSRLRIWSAACATGEEPLTIAMFLNEAGWLDRAPIEIIASDASDLAVAKAKNGIYRERSFRNMPAHLRGKYFEQRGGSWYVAPSLHSRVAWQTANLMEEDEVAHLATSTVVFCRNAFIYFSERSIRRTVELFYRKMPSPGYLFVGVAESLFRITSDFELQEIEGAFVYVKR